MLCVSGNVTRDFRYPVITIVHGDARPAGAIVSVPETTMNKDDFMATGKNNVGIAGDVLAMYAESMTKTMQERATSNSGLVSFDLTARIMDERLGSGVVITFFLNGSGPSKSFISSLSQPLKALCLG